MDAAARMLSRAWGRSGRAWWTATAATFAVALLVLVSSVGLVTGMQAASTHRVADFYTGDLRVTPAAPGAAPAGFFAVPANATLADVIDGVAAAAGPGASVAARVEHTALVSRRSLLEAFLLEDEGFTVALPGGSADRDAYLVGVLLGLSASEARNHVAQHVVVGAMPAPGDGVRMEVLLSVKQFILLLTGPERDAMGPLPTPQELARFRVEVTAAHLDASGQDLIRLPASISGLYDSGLDALDHVTLVTTLQDARRLVGADPQGEVANVLTVRGDAGDARRHAEAQGWAAEGPGAFTHRYAGEVLDVLRFSGILAAVGLLAVPGALLGLGLSQQLAQTRRELAVCRAIGLPLATVRRAFAHLAAWVSLAALILAGTGIALVAASTPWWSAAIPAPLPLGFVAPPGLLVLLLGLVVACVVAAWAGAARAVRRLDVASVLRAL